MTTEQKQPMLRTLYVAFSRRDIEAMLAQIQPIQRFGILETSSAEAL